MLSVLRNKMPTACSSSNHADISISDNEVDGTDYLLSSTIRLDENFLHALGKFIRLLTYVYMYTYCAVNHLTMRMFDLDEL